MNLMKFTLHLLAFLLLPLFVVACGQGESDAPGTVQGPALIMFYTDGWPPWLEMMPIVDVLEREFMGQAAVLQLDANEAENAGSSDQVIVIMWS